MSEFNEEKYSNKLPYPNSHEVRQAIKKEIDDTPMTAIQRQIAIEGLTQYVHERCKPEAEAYRQEDERLKLKFFKDAEAEYGFQDLPDTVKDKIHDLAYERGHSSGYSEIWSCYGDLVDLALLAFKEAKP